MEAAQEFSPTLVNCHALKDYFTAEMAEQFFDEVLAWQREKNYNVYHETHRKRFLHSPWVARSFVEKYPDMKVDSRREQSLTVLTPDLLASWWPTSPTGFVWRRPTPVTPT